MKPHVQSGSVSKGFHRDTYINLKINRGTGRHSCYLWNNLGQVRFLLICWFSSTNAISWCKFDFHNLLSGDDHQAKLIEDMETSAKSEVDGEETKTMSSPSLVVPISSPVDTNGCVKHSEGEFLRLAIFLYSRGYPHNAFQCLLFHKT